MIFLKRIITVAATVVGSLAGIILLALINAFANTGLSGGQVVLYGLIGGIVVGIVSGYWLTYLLVRKAKKIVFNKFAGTLAKFGLLKEFRLK